MATPFLSQTAGVFNRTLSLPLLKWASTVGTATYSLVDQQGQTESPDLNWKYTNPDVKAEMAQLSIMILPAARQIAQRRKQREQWRPELWCRWDRNEYARMRRDRREAVVQARYIYLNNKTVYLLLNYRSCSTHRFYHRCSNSNYRLRHHGNRLDYRPQVQSSKRFCSPLADMAVE